MTSSLFARIEVFTLIAVKTVCCFTIVFCTALDLDYIYLERKKERKQERKKSQNHNHRPFQLKSLVTRSGRVRAVSRRSIALLEMTRTKI